MSLRLILFFIVFSIILVLLLDSVKREILSSLKMDLFCLLFRKYYEVNESFRNCCSLDWVSALLLKRNSDVENGV